MEFAVDKSRWTSHLLVWIGGVLWALAPFIHAWEILDGLPLRLGNGQFGFNLIIGAFLFLFGGSLSAYLWRFCCWLQSWDSKGSMILSHSWLGFGILSALGWFGQTFYAVMTVLLLIAGVVYSFRCYKHKNLYLDPLNERAPLIGRLKKVHTYNLWFFILFAVILWLNNVVAAWRLDITGLEFISVSIGRFFFSGFLAIGLLLIAELSMRALPKYTRWVPWLVFAPLPFVIFHDLIQSQIYGRGVIEVVNNLTSNGSIDIQNELDAGGFGDLSAILLIGAILFCYLVAGLVAYLLWRLSSKSFKGVSLIHLGTLLTLCFSLSVVEQALGKYWKNLPSWQQENKLYMLNSGAVKPKLGLADFQVVFKGYEFVSSEQARRADIYIFMVESMRYDSMSEVTTPFLVDFSKDCQEFDVTLAASNATHLSWFGLFYSKPSFFWQDQLLGIEDKENFGGSPILGELNNMGYALDIRTICDLSYKEFGLLNFGSEGVICEIVEQLEEGNDLHPLNVPDREKIVMKRFRDSLLEDKNLGGNLYFTAFESPHYTYYWDDDFEVPYEEYKDDISFPLFPTTDEIRLYHNRYLNSVAWVDHQLKEFCDFLKAEGRYDDSIIIVTGDHGEEFQEDGGWCHCTSLMPEQTHVPLLIKWPADVKNAPAKYVASHSDVFPSRPWRQ